MSAALEKTNQILAVLKSHPEIQVQDRLEDSEMTCTCNNCHQEIYKTTYGEFKTNPELFDQKQRDHLKVCKVTTASETKISWDEE
jgi:hypothetical protein